MKLLMIAGLLLGTVLACNAQTDSLQFIQGIPVIRDDTLPQTLVEDQPPNDHLIRVAADTIPSRLRKTLNGDNMFNGWQKASLYFDLNTRLFILHLPGQDVIRTYHFSEEGKPVSYNETSKPRDQ
jgi:hypothetical protein